MSEHSIFLVLIAIIVTDFSLERVLSFLNGKSAKKDIPQELNGIYDEEKYAKSQEY
ncbi:MAG TPA: peptidase M48, partial [Cytophagales bacterium]|nr:peptidase M48 [Cytophagales bacterium]